MQILIHYSTLACTKFDSRYSKSNSGKDIFILSSIRMILAIGYRTRTYRGTPTTLMYRPNLPIAGCSNTDSHFEISAFTASCICARQRKLHEFQSSCGNVTLRQNYNSAVRLFAVSAFAAFSCIVFPAASSVNSGLFGSVGHVRKAISICRRRHGLMVSWCPVHGHWQKVQVAFIRL